MSIIAYTAPGIFTGKEWLTEHAIVVENGSIKSIQKIHFLDSSIETQAFKDCMIAPSFIDLQIYGAAGKLVAAYPEADSLQLLYEHCLNGGTAWCLPTIATNPPEVFYRSIDAVRQYWRRGGKGILGLHFEGPWISRQKNGAHDVSLIHAPELEEVRSLLDYGNDVIKMITIAPEVCSDQIIELIKSYGIVLSAGHSNCSYEEAKAGFSKGIKAVTHLFNTMTPLNHRSPGLTGAAMDDDNVMVSIIPDGYHADFAAVRIAKKATGERLFIITDAVTETNQGAHQHRLAGDKYECNGVLSGSALSMVKAVRNCIEHVHIKKDEALRMAASYPAQVLGLHSKGFLKEGYDAEMVVLDQQLNVMKVIA